MTLVDLANFICGKVGQSDAATVAVVKGFIRARYQLIYDSALWRDSLILVSGVSASTDTIILDQRIERVVGVRYDDHELIPSDLGTLIQTDPAIFERTGTPLMFSELTPVATFIAPPSGVIKIVSDSASDSSINVQIRGELGGVEQSEVVSLNGTTPVTSVNYYDVVYTLSKPTTTGNVYAKNIANVILLTLWPEESERKYTRIRLHEAPSDVTKTLLILGKRRLRQLTSDLDTPMIRSIDNALIAFAQSDLLERLRQYAKAQAKLQEATNLLEVVRDLEKKQNANISRVIPAIASQYESESLDGDLGWLRG